MRNDGNTIMVLVFSIDYDGQTSSILKPATVCPFSVANTSYCYPYAPFSWKVRPSRNYPKLKIKSDFLLKQLIYIIGISLLNVSMETEEPETVTECCQKRKLSPKRIGLVKVDGDCNLEKYQLA